MTFRFRARVRSRARGVFRRRAKIRRPLPGAVIPHPYMAREFSLADVPVVARPVDGLLLTPPSAWRLQRGQRKASIYRAFGRSGPGRDRTCDLGIKSPLLYQLSYRPVRPSVRSHASRSCSTFRRCASLNSKRPTSRRASAGSLFSTAASRCSRSGVGWRSWRRSQRRRLTSAASTWAVTGSNRRPPACKAGALPAELTALA
jgi:hypothetical protein